jgi:hypothetical protein
MIRVNPRVPTKGYVVDGFDVKELKEFRGESGEAPISVFTEKEFDLLKYAPSTLFRINLEHDLNFPIDRDHSRRQLEVDIISQYSVLESAVQGGYYTPADFIHNKASSFLKIQTRINDFGSRSWYSLLDRFPSPEEIDGNYDLPIPNGLLFYCPAHLSSISDRLAFIYQLKQVYSELVGKQKILDESRTEVRSGDRKGDIKVSSDLRAIFGKNIDAVMFGSATYENGDPEDYDFIVLTDHIREEYFRNLESANLRLDNKPVDIVLVRRNYWENYVVKNPFSQGIVRDGIVVAGDVEFPALDRRESVLRSVSRAVGRIRMLHGVALNWAGLKPDELVSKSGLLVSLSKVPRYVLSGLLELRDMENGEQFRRYTKPDLEEILSDIGLKKSDFSKIQFEKGWLFPQPAIQEFLYEVMVQTAQVVDRFYSPTWISDYKEQINRVNNPGEGFLERIQFELGMEKRLYDAWKIAEVK